MKQKYMAPAVKRRLALHSEGCLLAGSVVNNSTTIETAGQKVEEHDFSQTGFNATWE